MDSIEILKKFPQKISNIKIIGYNYSSNYPQLFSYNPNWDEHLHNLFILRFNKLIEEINIANNILLVEKMEEQEKREYLRLKEKYDGKI